MSDPRPLRPIRSLLAYGAFVIAASVCANLLTLGAYAMRDREISGAFEGFHVGVLMYAPAVALFALLIFVPLVLFLRTIAARGVFDASAGALTGFFATLILFLPNIFSTPLLSDGVGIDAHLWTIGVQLWFAGLHAIAGAFGGLAYWFAAGRPTNS